MTDAQMREGLEAALTARSRRPVRGAELVRRRSEYCTSFTVEELDVTLADGSTLELVYKPLHPDSMLDATRDVKPPFLMNPRREIEVYREVLAPAVHDVPHFYGDIEQPEAHRFGLFLERVRGTHLWQIGDFAAWEAAARWLAALHGGPATAAATARCSHLLRYDRDFHRQWLNRAYRLVLRDPARGPADHAIIRDIARVYERVVDHLCALPPVFIHGDYHASNILHTGDGDDHRIRPIDWELAGVGPAVIDVAAVTAGNWSDHERHRMVVAYWLALPQAVRQTTSLETLSHSVEYARLYWAVRWLGWSEQWTPPRRQARDWLADARDAATRLGLAIEPVPDFDRPLAPPPRSPA